jgi:hypothetical protein
MSLKCVECLLHFKVMHRRGKIVSLLCDLTVLFSLFLYDNHKGTEDTEERKECVGTDSLTGASQRGVAQLRDDSVGAIPPWWPQNPYRVGTLALPLPAYHSTNGQHKKNCRGWRSLCIAPTSRIGGI